MSGVTDCYQPIERKLQLTRRCLAVLAEFRNPVSIITKNFLAWISTGTNSRNAGDRIPRSFFCLDTPPGPGMLL